MTSRLLILLAEGKEIVYAEIAVFVNGVMHMFESALSPVKLDTLIQTAERNAFNLRTDTDIYVLWHDHYFYGFGEGEDCVCNQLVTYNMRGKRGAETYSQRADQRAM